MVVACSPCRKRKIRCDGNKPFCLQCRQRLQHCSYDRISDKRKRSHAEFEELTQRYERVNELIATIAEGGTKSEEVVRMLQMDLTASKSLKGEELSSQVPLENIEFENKLLRSDGHGKLSFYGETSNVPMIVQNAPKESRSVPSLSPDFSKINPTLFTETPEEKVLELLTLYFSWQHTYYNIFNKELFLRDMQTNGPFFSEFLLYSILAHAVHFSDQYEEGNELNDPFYKRAIAMLPDELENASITTIQGLLLLASKESGVGKISLGWIHSGIAFRIAIDLGLHLDGTKLKSDGTILEDEDNVRQDTFWGCYIFDHGWSFYLGRPSAMNELDILLEFPTYIHEHPMQWAPFYENDGEHEGELLVVFYPRNTRTAIIKLYLILKEIISSIYSPSFKKNSKQNYLESLEMCHKRLVEWQAELPNPLQYNDAIMHPAVIMVHTMYHSAIVFLFRPFFKLGGQDWTHGSIPDPLEKGKISANSIIDLLERYNDSYSLRKIPNLAVYVSSTATTVFLATASLGIAANVAELSTCRTILCELCKSWPDAKPIYKILDDRLEGNKEQEALVMTKWDDYQFNDLQDLLFGSDFYIDWRNLSP